MPNKYDSFVQSTYGNPAPENNVAAVQDIPPQQAADAVNAAERFKTDPSVFLPDPLQAKTAAAQADAQSALAVAPNSVRTTVGASPTNAALFKDAIPQLSALDYTAQAWAGYQGPLSSIISAFHAAHQQALQGSTISSANPGPFNIEGWKGVGQALAGLWGMASSPFAALTDPAARTLASLPLPMYSTPNSLDPSTWDMRKQRELLPDERLESAGGAINTALLGLTANVKWMKFQAERAAEGRASPTEPGPPPPPSSPGHIPTDGNGYVLGPDGKPQGFASQRDAGKFATQGHEGSDQIFDMATHPDSTNQTPLYAVREVGRTSEPFSSEVPPPGTSETGDEFHAREADNLASGVAAMQEQLADPALAHVPPSKIEEALDNTALAGKTAYVDPKALIKLSAEGLMPFPEHTNAILDALQSGREVPIPINTYLAATAGKPFAEDLNSATRFSEMGVSQNEAKETPKPTEASKISIGIDNPGGDWLERKQQAAAEGYNPAEEGMAAKGLQGPVTGYIEQGSAILPVEELSKLTGVHNENPVPGTPKYDALMASVEASGGFEPDRHAIVVGVNHKGEAYLMEGNNRVAVAKRLGIKHIKAEVQWRNGGEKVEGPFSPANVKKMHAGSGREEAPKPTAANFNFDRTVPTKFADLTDDELEIKFDQINEDQEKSLRETFPGMSKRQISKDPRFPAWAEANPRSADSIEIGEELARRLGARATAARTRFDNLADQSEMNPENLGNALATGQTAIRGGFVGMEHETPIPANEEAQNVSNVRDITGDLLKKEEAESEELRSSVAHVNASVDLAHINSSIIPAYEEAENLLKSVHEQSMAAGKQVPYSWYGLRKALDSAKTDLHNWLSEANETELPDKVSRARVNADQYIKEHINPAIEDLHKELAGNQNAGLNYPEDLTGEELEKLGSIPALASHSVDQVFKEHFLSQLAESPGTFGMDKAQFARYSAGLEEARAATLKKLLDRTYTQIRRERTPEWKDQVARQSAEVEKEVVARRDIAARNELQYGQGPLGEPLERPGIKLDRNITQQIYGKDTTDALPQGIFRQKDSVHPEQAAELFGYDSGEAMLHDLINLETDRVRGGFTSSKAHTQAIIKAEAEARARAELGYDVSPEGMARAAQEAMVEPAITDLLTAQMKALSERVGIPITKEEVEEDAKQLFAKLSAKEAAKPSTFVKGMQRTGKAVQVALEKGKWEEAFRAKQQQLLNQLQYAMSQKFLRMYNSAKRSFADLASSRQKNLIEQSFLDAIHGELQKYGYSVPQANLAYRFEKWAEEQRAMGYSVIEPQEIPAVPVDSLSVEQFVDLKDRIDNMVWLGKKAQEVIRGAAKESMEQAVNEAVLGANNLKVKGISNAGVPETNHLSRLNAEVSQVQPLLDKLDDNNANGVFNDILRKPAVAAHGKMLALREEDHNHIDAEFDKFSNVERANFLRNIPAGHGLLNPVTGEEMDLKVGDIIGMALNSGTELGRWHLEEGGWGWDREAVQALFDKYLTPEMVDFIEAIHNYMEKVMWPRLADHEFESTGLAPYKEQPLPIRVRNREIPGGYFPLVRDPERAPLIGNSNPDLAEIFKDKIIRPSTPTGFLQRRVSASYPVSLNWQNTLFHHINDVSNRVAYSEFISSAMRFLSQQDIKQLLATYGGPNARQLILDSLQRQVGVRLVSPLTDGIFADIARAARKNFYLVGSTMKVPILLEHLSAIPQAIQVMGAQATWEGYVRYMSNPLQAAKFAWDSSAYLRSRHNEIDVNMRDLADDMQGKGRGLLAHVDMQLAKLGINTDLGLPVRLTQKGAMAILNWVNHYTIAIPHWLGAYYSALRGNAKLNGVPQPIMNHENAVAFADKVVSLAHGSGAPMDLSRVQEGYNELGKLLNVYYTYHGTQLNLTKGAIGRMAQGRTAGERGQGLFQFSMVLLAALVGAFVSHKSWDALFGDKATDTTRLAWVADNIAGGMSGQLPYIGRDLDNAADQWFFHHKVELNNLPILQMPQTVGNAAADLELAREHKPMHPNAIRDLVEGSSYLTGNAGGGQEANTLQGLYDWRNHRPGDEHPIAGTIYGPAAENDYNEPRVRTGSGHSRGHR